MDRALRLYALIWYLANFSRSLQIGINNCIFIRSLSIEGRTRKFFGVRMAANSSFAVVISVAEAHYQRDTSVVNCLKCTYHDDVHKFRPYGVPFRLNAQGFWFIIDDSFLEEQKIKEGALIETSNGGCFSKKTGFQLVSL